MARNQQKQVEEVLAAVEAPIEPLPDPEELGMTPTFGIPKKRQVVKVKVKQYRVDRGPLPTGGWVVVFNGSRTELGMGKIINQRQYDIEKLRKMGVQMTEMDEIEV